MKLNLRRLAIIDSLCLYDFSHDEISIKEFPFITQTTWHVVSREVHV